MLSGFMTDPTGTLTLLLLSLPGICSLRLSPSGPHWVPLGDRAELMLLGSCSLPMPPFRGRILLESCLTGQMQLYDPGTGFPASHCGSDKSLSALPHPHTYSDPHRQTDS